MSDKELFDPSPRQFSTFALVRNKAGELLLLDKKNRSAHPDRWGLPGGTITPGEEAPVAGQRWVRATTGLKVVLDRLLVVHQMPVDDEAPEELNTVFDAGPEISGQKITLSEEFTSYQWVHPVYVSGILPPHMTWRIRCALDALNGAPVRFLCGQPDQEAWDHLAA